MKDDRDLVAETLEGGIEAFGEIVDRYRDAVFGVSLARLRNFHDAEDVAQTVFVEAFAKLDRLRDPKKLGAWLRTIAIRRSVDLIRTKKERVGTDDLEPEKTEPSNSALREQVLGAIGKLGKAQRETVTLYYINGYSVGEVAAMQESPVGTVKRRLHEARKKLKTEMMKTVKGVLRAEAPKEDFGARVFELISSYMPWNHRARLSWPEIQDELREIGSEGMPGYLKALESPHVKTRKFAVMMLDSVKPDSDATMQLLQRFLQDPNRQIRGHAIAGLLVDNLAGLPDEQIHQDVVPLVVPLLSDSSYRVRCKAARSLAKWASSVPLHVAADALANEQDSRARAGMAELVGAIVIDHKADTEDLAETTVRPHTALGCP